MVDPILFILRFFFDFWWLFLPFFLGQVVWEKFLNSRKRAFRIQLKWSFFEIKFPAGVLRNPRAMEEVFNGLHAIAPSVEKDLSWWNLNIKGFQPKFYTLIFIANDGKLRFYLRYPPELKEFIKSRFYTQYPDVQFIDVEDPLEIFTFNTPNSLLETEIFDLRLNKEDSYPIKTFSALEYLPKEQQIDPITTFIEAASHLSDKEWLIFQIFVLPTTADNPQQGNKWVERGQKMVNKLIGKEEKKEPGPWDEIQQFIINLLLAPFREPVWKKDEEKPKEEFNLQRLTPGERKIIESIQQKISKLGFWCSGRIVYLAYKNIFEINKSNALALINGILKNFSTEDLNGLSAYPLTMLTSVGTERDFIIKRNAFFFFKVYRPPSPPKVYADKLKKLGLDKGFILNSEELATLFHPPMEFVPPTGIEKIPTKELPPFPEIPLIK
jgi:hypothetical protein